MVVLPSHGGEVPQYTYVEKSMIKELEKLQKSLSL